MRNMRQHLLISALMLSGLMPMGSGPGPEPVLDHGHRSREKAQAEYEKALDKLLAEVPA